MSIASAWRQRSSRVSAILRRILTSRSNSTNGAPPRSSTGSLGSKTRCSQLLIGLFRLRFRESNCSGIRIGPRLERRANERIRPTGVHVVIEQEIFAEQEFLKFPDGFYVCFQISFRVRPNEVVNRIPT